MGDDRYPRRRGARILDQSWREDVGQRRVPPMPALERLRSLLDMRVVTRFQVAHVLGVSEAELWEWLFGYRWQPTMETLRAIHAWADRMWSGDRTARGLHSVDTEPQ